MSILNERFGQREITDVVFKAKADMSLFGKQVKRGQPVLFIDSATASTIEQASTTVYARGGRGNNKLIAWEGEKELTFSVTDALLSPISLAMLSGADIFNGKNTADKVHVHISGNAFVGEGSDEIDVTAMLLSTDDIDANEIFVLKADTDGSIQFGEVLELAETKVVGKKIKLAAAVEANTNVFVDFYVLRAAAKVAELQIGMDNFAGFYYVEASTLFRAQGDSIDRPVEMTLPNVKIQSNFTFNMSPTGDPTTFEFNMDAMPGYTLFNPTKKVLMAMQIVEETESADANIESVMKGE